MAIKIKRYLLIILLSFIFSLKSNTQETNKKLPLSEILSALEKQFNIQFNYAEDAIFETKIAPPSKQLSLNKTLQYLENQTDFEYIVTDENVVLVISKVKNSKLQELSEVMVSGYIVKGINKLNNGSFEIDVSDFDILPGLIDTCLLYTSPSPRD